MWLQDFNNIHWSPTEFSWDNKQAGAAVLLAQLTADHRYIHQTADFCQRMTDTIPRTPAGLVFIQPWGSLRHASNVAFICMQAATGIKHPAIESAKLADFARQQIHYALGDTGRSYVVGYGVNPPTQPHHRSSSCPVDIDVPCGWNNYYAVGPNPSILWGALVGGPNRADEFTDKRDNHVTNEVALDYNAGFQSAVAGLKYLSMQC